MGGAAARGAARSRMRPIYEREELFAAWRRFFERLADDAPTVLVFEDLQWADAGLLDFIEHLATWARDHAILILTLARPELLDARPTWGAAQRSFTALRLDRLSDAAMGELLTGRARGIPAAALRHILERAGGVPLYAVELTRMLIDRGQLVPIHGAYRLAGALTDADLPDSLLGLLGARIDALPAPERSVLRAAAALGRRFSPEALGAVTGLHRAELQRRVASLVEREVLAYDDELRSPASGQVAFVQDLVRELRLPHPFPRRAAGCAPRRGRALQRARRRGPRRGDRRAHGRGTCRRPVASGRGFDRGSRQQPPPAGGAASAVDPRAGAGTRGSRAGARDAGRRRRAGRAAGGERRCGVPCRPALDSGDAPS